MYSVSAFANDIVTALTDLPQSSVGAPCPMLLGDEQHLLIAYYIQNTPPGWDGTSVKVVGPDTPGEPYAVVRFSGHIAYYHGSPNDEAFAGHPLYKKGLHPYGAYEIKHSSWIRRLMKMNRVHPHHRDAAFADYSHYAIAFHDSVFECIATGYTFCIGDGTILEAVGKLLAEFAE